ncbi:hypothetical protein [Paracoccus amoyensis]|uniref:hypothetical protein n=1 Tax=Paracoccus amoyensis TaxID=2760093 RepID=UPI001FE24C2E|nr:hypothetical protein [Paracoccus amoyensis]
MSENADTFENGAIEGTGLSEPGPDRGRRAFLRATGASAFGAALGMTIPFERNLPHGLIPVALPRIPVRI